jgi:hypothetical protein
MEQFTVTQPDLNFGFLAASNACKGNFLLCKRLANPAFHQSNLSFSISTDLVKW